MTVFTTEEINLICIYDPGSRKGTIKELKNMMRYLMPDETDLHDLADSVIQKLKDMNDEEYDELSESLTPDCSFDCEDSVYGGFSLGLFDEIDPDSQQCAMDTFQIVQRFAMHACQFFINSHRPVFIGFLAFGRIGTTIAVFTLIDFFLTSVLVAFDILSVTEKK